MLNTPRDRFRAYRMARQLCVLAALSGIPFVAMAQDEEPAAEVSENQVPVQAQSLAPEQLADLVAPIALYPDPLLSQVLVASTYPMEVVEAQQWLQRNRRLTGQQLMDAAREQDWDASVQGLVAFPDVLATLNEDVQWTTALGNAFLAQQSDVMSAVQRMRARAQANGRLSSTPQQTVTTETEGAQSVIEIVPADPQVIYVPEYDPAYVWGPPAWGYYPPLAYASFGFGFGPGIDIGFCFGGWSGWGWRGWGWGWGPNWLGGSVFVNGAFFRHHGFHSRFLAGGFADRRVWRHDPGHRLGVPYRNAQLAARYQSASLASRNTMTGSGNWNRVGSGAVSTYGNRSVTQGARASTPWSTGRPTDEQWRRSPGAQREQVPAQRYSAPIQRYAAPAQRYPAPVQRYAAPAERYPVPVQRYSAPAQRYPVPVQRYSAPVQRYAEPVQRYAAPAQRYSVPVQRYSAPAQRYSAPVQRYSAPVQRYPDAVQRPAFSPRTSPTGSGGRSFGGGVGSYSPSRGGGVRSTGGGHGFGGGSHGDGHRR